MYDETENRMNTGEANTTGLTDSRTTTAYDGSGNDLHSTTQGKQYYGYGSSYSSAYGQQNAYSTAGYGSYSQVHSDYQSAQYGASAKPGKEKKKAGTFKKLCVGAGVGLCFGAFAAAGFYGVQKGAEYLGLGSSNQAAVIAEEDGRSSYASSLLMDESDDVQMANVTTTAVVTDVTNVVENVMPSIVTITNTGSYSYYYYTIPSESSGSGIIIGSNDDELLIVTNYHVVADNDSLSVTFVDGSEAEALVKGTDASMDLAVIAVAMDDISDSSLNEIKIAKMGDSEALKVGEPAIAIGNALGYGQSVTTGVISALNREMEMENGTGVFIQTDAAINPGNSGGALLNISGEVIGINSNKIGGSSVEGMGYAIPISAARPIIEDLMVKTTRTLVDEEERGYLGITGATVTAQEAMIYGYPEGVYVANVNDGSAADIAGLQKGDYISSFDGETVSSMEGLQRLLMYYKEGETVEIRILRPSGNSYKEMTLQLTLGDKSVLGRTN